MTASQLLSEEAAAVSENDRFDIFLSHAVRDAEAIRGIKVILEEQGNTVYVDWIVDRQLDRERVTSATAEVLRTRMRQSASMFFVTSESSPFSKWMPWELGYYDGLHQGRIAVFPLVEAKGGDFQGQEYVGLYPVVEHLQQNNVSRAFVTRGKGTKTYMSLSNFRAGQTTFNRI